MKSTGRIRIDFFVLSLFAASLSDLCGNDLQRIGRKRKMENQSVQFKDTKTAGSEMRMFL